MMKKEISPAVDSLLEECISVNQDTYTCVSEVARFFNERNDEQYEEFLKNPYMALLSEFGPELCTIDYEELSALLGSKKRP